MESKHANGMILEVDEQPKKISEWIILAIQHVLAMFVACITVPLIVFGSYVNVDGSSLAQTMIAPTIVSAGIGTIIYIILTKMKSPMFLASSFAYISPMSAAVSLGSQIVYDANGNMIGLSANVWALPIGMAFVGLVYIIVALVIKFAGVGWLNKLLPTIVVGPVIMVIGLGLSTSAISNLTSASGNSQSYNLIAILSGVVAMAVTAICAHYGKKTLSLIPFVIGMGAGYLTAMVFTLIGYYACGNEYFHIIDFSPLINLFTKVDAATGERVANITIQSFLDIPDFIFLPQNWNYVASDLYIMNDAGELVKFTANTFSASQIGTIALLFIPVSFVTICEHIGDHKNMSGLLQRDLLEKPGLTRTLMGDGIATAASGILCGAANTTYGENVAVVGVTKIASVKVILLACIFSILLGFLAPVMALTQTIPTCVTGGVSLLLYGFIAASGVKMMITEHIDMGKTKNIFVASVILVSGIGGLSLKFVDPDNPLITVTSTAVAMILGILMNLLLKDKPEEPKADSEN
jgi:uracil permease